MTVQEFYESIGGSYTDMIHRLGNDDRICMYLKRFVAESGFAAMQEAVEHGTVTEAFHAAHDFKGAVAMFSMDKLSDAVCQLVEQMRPCTDPVDLKLYEKVNEEYQKVIEGINKL